jgi:cytoskeletal protein CcmA (bactofilin family)
MDDDQQNPLEVSENTLDSPEVVSEPVAPVVPPPQPAPDQSGNVVQDPESQAIPQGKIPAAEPEAEPAPPTNKIKTPFRQKLKSLFKRINIYILLFLLILLLAGIATFASYTASKNSNKGSITGQDLSTADLQDLKNNNSTVGDAKDTLTIASNSIFNGRVLLKDDLDVAGTLRIGGAINVPGIAASGTSTFGTVQVSSNLAVAGNGAVQGTMSIQKNLTVGGGASFAGTIYAPAISVDSFIINKDLSLNRHITAGGTTPGVSGGGGLGGGGTTSISGSDTAGTVNVNFGGGPVAGVLAYVTFANAFSQTPHVVIAPVGSGCSALNYYVSRTTTGFTIATSNAGSAGASCAFDFIIFD